MPSTALCKRCKSADGAYVLRNDPTCRDCFLSFVESKGGRRLGAVARDTRAPGRPGPRRYLAGLSFGPCSTALMQILDTSCRFHSSKKSSPAFEPLVVHVDTDLSHSAQQDHSPAKELLAHYRRHFTNLTFDCIHLSKIWTVKTIDWAALGLTEVPGTFDPVARLVKFFDDLPSMTSKADTLRLFIRHLLLNEALERSYTALLLGHTTTALAALTVAEVAHGRGYAVPWQVNDGPYSVCLRDGDPASPGTKCARQVAMPVYYPLREVFKNEIMTYLDLVPTVKDLMPEDGSNSGNIVSHKDMSISDVVERYFESVEGAYSGIVANVVRTTGKLDGVVSGEFCRLCGMTLDGPGDSRWAGELGDEIDEFEVDHEVHLCYGCRRTIRG